MEHQSETSWTFIGLGNPGKKYEMTRHNMGAIVVQGFAKMHGMPLKDEPRFPAKVAKVKGKETTLHLVLPATYMNQSGSAVRKYLDYFKLAPENIVVVSDDADLPFGEMRLRSQGSSGGHNGLKSVQEHLGTTHFPRLRIGIGRKHEVIGGISDYVLERFTKEEAEQLLQTIEAGVTALNKVLSSNIDSAMNVVNRKKNKTLEGDKQEERI